MIRFALLAGIASAASVASAQPASGNAGLSLPFGAVPTEIAGVPCQVRPGDANFAPSLQCRPASIVAQPSISVSVAEWRSRPTREQMAENAREAFHERPIFNIIREEPFAPPGDPEAIGFRAFYQTDLGHRFVWYVLTRGQMIRVSVAVFAQIDLESMKADIEWKIFGVPTANDNRD